jgi:predicted dehydrogenase
MRLHPQRLGVAFVGGGAAAQAHLQAFAGVPDAEVRGVWDADRARAAATGARPYPSIAAMIADPAIEALWLCGPADARVAHMEEIADAVLRARGKLLGIACEVPLASSVAAAQRVAELAAHAGVKHCYLEHQVFAPELARARATFADPPSHARAAEAHTGPHPSRDMLCHATQTVRYLLTPPGASPGALRPQRVTGRKSEDAASALIEFEAPGGRRVTGETTTAWRAGPSGLQLSAEVTGLAGSTSWTSLDHAASYEAEDRHFARAILGLEEPSLTFAEGLDVVRLVTAAWQSAAEGRALDYPPPGLERFVPLVGRET